MTCRSCEALDGEEAEDAHLCHRFVDAITAAINAEGLLVVSERSGERINAERIVEALVSVIASFVNASYRDEPRIAMLRKCQAFFQRKCEH